MRFLLASLVALAVAVGCAAGQPVRERWGGPGLQCAHPDTLKVVPGSAGARLVFDLSAIPAGARVHHASLYCFTQGGRQPNETPRIRVVQGVDAQGNPARIQPGSLALEGPWYRSFDATEAVRRWVNDRASNHGLVVSRFEGLVAGRTYLDVLYDGRARNLPEQVAGLEAVHHDGQTFLVWREVEAFRPRPEEVIWVKKFSERGDVLAEGPGQGAYGMGNHPAITLRALRRLQGLALRDKPSGFQGIRPLRRARKVPDIRYRVYRHSKRITPENIHRAQLLAEVAPLSGYDKEVYRIHFKGEYIDQREEPASVIPTYRVGRDRALQPGQGLYVHTPSRAGEAYYAVTTVLAGTENLADISEANSLTQPVAETPATPQPVLQWVQQDFYRDDPTEYWYRYWAAPPYCNLPSRSFRLAVAVPNRLKGPDDMTPQETERMKPLPLSIGTISGAMMYFTGPSSGPMKCARYLPTPWACRP